MFLQRQVKTAISKSSSWGDFLKRLEEMYSVDETDLSVRSEIEEIPPLPEIPTAARISEFVAQREELMGSMNPSSNGPTEPDLWLVGKIPRRTWENFREMSEREARTHSYDELVGLLIELAMVRENDSHMDKYVRKHLRRESPAERPQGERLPEPHSNAGKRKGEQLKHMKENPPTGGREEGTGRRQGGSSKGEGKGPADSKEVRVDGEGRWQRMKLYSHNDSAALYRAAKAAWQ